VGGPFRREVTALGWALTFAVIVALLALDLTLGVLRPPAVGFREAAVWSVFYVAVAVGTPLSLAVIVVVLAVTTVASLLKVRKGPDSEPVRASDGGASA
jgi:hypothetical protein